MYIYPTKTTFFHTLQSLDFPTFFELCKNLYKRILLNVKHEYDSLKEYINEYFFLPCCNHDFSNEYTNEYIFIPSPLGADTGYQSFMILETGHL